jgi:glycosyltransferase involved in cell wall biosynthesis
LHIVIVVPRQPNATGNHVSAARHRNGLRALGYQVDILEAVPGEAFPAEALATFAPDIVHLLHAYRSGAPWLESGLHLPFIVTLTGTDIHQGIDDVDQGPVIRAVLGRAAAVITHNRLTFVQLQKEPDLASRLHYLAPGIVLGAEPFPLRERLGASPEEVIFLHPAGIRPVKGNLQLLQLLAPIAAAFPHLRLVFCGPILDSAYGERFRSALAACPWASWLGTLPPAAMPAAMRQADLILNHSVCEGLPNALLEAAALGRPILARAIAGNAAVVDQGINGLLYHDAEEFTQHARTLLDNPSLRQKLSRPRPDLYDPAREAENLAAIYAKVLLNS